MTTQLKDVAIMALNEGRIERILAKFAKGETTKQEAFALLVDNNTKDMKPYIEALSNGNLRLVRGASARQTELLKNSALRTCDLATTYIAPSVALAKSIIEDRSSEAYRYVIENLVQPMDPTKGDITAAPAFTPSRIAAAGKALTAKDNSPFTVHAEEGLLLLERRFGSYNIEDIKQAVRTGSSSPDALDDLIQFLGMDEEETPNKKERLGTLGNFIKKVRERYEGTENNQFALDAVETLEATMDDLRSSLISEMRLSASVKNAEKDQARAQRRLARKQRLGAERETSVTAESNTQGEVEVA